MPSATPRSTLAIRPRPPTESQTPINRKHAPCTSYPESSPLDNFSFYNPPTIYSDRPSKRSMTTPSKTIAVVNSSGRQAASFIRVASAVGYNVRAQLRNLDGIVASEISSLPNVTVLVGDLFIKRSSSSSSTLDPETTKLNDALIRDLFHGAQLAFINTTFWGDEYAIGCALADAAAAVGIEHYIYSSMPNHSVVNSSWPSLPLWSEKYAVETYIRTQLPCLRSTFLYTGIYNNNFTSLPYPLFCMALQPDGSFEWQAPFHPDVPLPWLDAEHDVGPAVLQVFKDGPPASSSNPRRIPLAYEFLSPKQACAAFARGVGRPVIYKHNPDIEVRVKIPKGYKEQLVALERMYALGKDDLTLQPPYFAEQELENKVPEEALKLWEGYRGLEEYAREVFPLEEAANGLTWMVEENYEDRTYTPSEVTNGGVDENPNYEEDDDDDDGLTIGGGLGTSGEATPARKEETWLA
ncbi:e5e04e29-1015-468d-8753-5b746a534183 [Sclerotinia trifoliorum]|uniref:E5e04e29-1015-468d-8753-5b746a534183 n=1 Tax=Sclerotinia trifoliorum TaxID=28548 RepID=A0A8H2W320_9HELO|nr:e5e04e29-1015-468d-8753-5b746a534183 [Sclerotinia trifoliorum]